MKRARTQKYNPLPQRKAPSNWAAAAGCWVFLFFIFFSCLSLRYSQDLLRNLKWPHGSGSVFVLLRLNEQCSLVHSTIALWSGHVKNRITYDNYWWWNVLIMEVLQEANSVITKGLVIPALKETQPGNSRQGCLVTSISLKETEGQSLKEGVAKEYRYLNLIIRLPQTLHSKIAMGLRERNSNSVLPRGKEQRMLHVPSILQELFGGSDASLHLRRLQCFKHSLLSSLS